MEKKEKGKQEQRTKKKAEMERNEFWRGSEEVFIFFVLPCLLIKRRGPWGGEV
jgi:hypothetical protein